MDKLYRDLTLTTQSEKFDSVHLSEFQSTLKTLLINLESKMQKAQTISSLVLSPVKEMIKVRQPLQKVMIPVLDETEGRN
jgi:isoleucyl-tRNA synthetase